MPLVLNYFSLFYQGCICREFQALKGLQLIAHFTDTETRGKFTLIVAGAVLEHSAVDPDIIRYALQQLDQGQSRSQASQEVAKMLNVPHRMVYQLALTLPS